jgi:hypothetical protein
MLSPSKFQWLVIAALGEVSVFCQDAEGNFTRKAMAQQDGGWLMSDLGGWR